MGFLDPNSWANALSSDPTGSRYAAELGRDASMAGIAMQKDQFDYQKSLMDPYVQGSRGNYDRLMAESAPGGYQDQWTMDKFKNSVPYQSMMDPELLKQISDQENANAAKSGMFGNSAVSQQIAKNLQTNALESQGAAYGQWTDAYNRLAGRTGLGAAQQVGAAGAQYANSSANALNNQAGLAGQANINNTMARNNAFGSMTNGAGANASQLIQDYIGNKGYFAQTPDYTGGNTATPTSDPYVNDGTYEAMTPVDGW
jgi:hypothetical protein